MRNFALHEMYLLSDRERRARHLRFHPTATVIKGPNHTGKSSIIKYIYRCFGAEPGKIPSPWTDAQISTLIRFSIDEEEHHIYRTGNSFSLFTGDGTLIDTYRSVTNELGPALAGLFNFNLKLPNQKREQVLLPPAYLLLPYYIDQDTSWTENWASFTRLRQFSGWRQSVVYYHTGIRSNEYYERQGVLRKKERENGETAARLEALQKVRKQLEAKLANARFDIDVAAYKKEIDRLLKQCEQLKLKEERYKARLIELDTERIRLEAQHDIVEATRKELHADYEYAVHELEEEEVHCPTCGTVHQNSFVERFAIARDEHRCRSLLGQLRDDLKANAEAMAEHRALLDQTTAEQEEIRRILAEKQGEVTLQTLIENEGRKELASTLDRDIEAVWAEVASLGTAIVQLKDRLRSLDHPDRRKEIVKHYQDRMHRYLWALNVMTLKRKSYEKIDAPIKESGSNLPRALLAYSFAILHTIRTYGSSTFCPIVIDSPRQQDQDDPNHERILRFIQEQRPPGSQLVLGLVDDCGIDFGGEVVVLTDEYNALREQDYEWIADTFRPFEEANLFGI